MRSRLSSLIAAFAAALSCHAQPADGPSFDCQKAKSKSERLICGDQELSRMDRELAVLFKAARASASDPQEFAKTSADEWRARERTCQDKACLVQWYEKRKLQLAASASAPASVAPPAKQAATAAPAIGQVPQAATQSRPTVGQPTAPITAQAPTAPPQIAITKPDAAMANSRMLGEWWCKYGDLVLNDGGGVVKFMTDTSISRQMGIINLKFSADGKVTNTYDDKSGWKGNWTEDKFGDGDKNAYLTKWNGAQFWAIPAVQKGFPVREGRVFGGTLLCGRNK